MHNYSSQQDFDTSKKHLVHFQILDLQFWNRMIISDTNCAHWNRLELIFYGQLKFSAVWCSNSLKSMHWTKRRAGTGLKEEQARDFYLPFYRGFLTAWKKPRETKYVGSGALS